MKKNLSFRLVPGILAASIVLGIGGAAVPAGFANSIQSYSEYAQQANTFIERGDLSKAIELLEKAYPIAPEQSVSVVINNLAAVYMRRGNYFHEKEKNDARALSDFRRAYYLLEMAWPEGLDRKPLHHSNLKIAKDNLKIAYTNLKLDPNSKDLHLKLAKELRLQGKFQESMVEYARVVELDSNNGEALKAIGDLFTVLNLPDKAKKYYAQSITAMGTSAQDDVFVQLANSQNKSGSINEAIANLNKALELNPNNTSALNQLEAIWKNEIKYNPSSVLGHANLAGVYQKMKRYQEALAQYNAAEHFANRDTSVPFETKKLIRLNMGTLFQELEKYDQALNAYDTILQADRKNLLATYYKARLFREAGNVDEAIRWYHNVLAIEANYENAHGDLLELIIQQDDPNKVIAGLRTYGDRFPQNALVQTKVGEEFHKLKSYENAAEYYQRALQLKPDVAATHANLGAVYQALGQEDAALSAFNLAAELDPKNETVLNLARETKELASFKTFQQALDLQKEGRHEESIPMFKQALETSPDNASLLVAYGVALQNTQRFKDAITQYQKALKAEPDNAHYLYYLGTAYHQNQQLDLALAQYKKAVAKDATLSDAQQALQMIEQANAAANLEKAVDAYTQKKYAEALTLVNGTLKTDPDNATAHYYKGLILNEQKQAEGAISSYRQAIRHNPEFGDAYYALALVLDAKKDEKGAKDAFQRFIELSAGEDDDFVKYAKQRVGTP